jgi:proliferating cell nuclear antigen
MPRDVVIVTTQTYPFRTLIDSIKDMLGDVNISITPGENNTLEDNSDNEGRTRESKVHNKKKKRQNTINNSDSDDDKKPKSKSKKKKDSSSDDDDKKPKSKPKKKKDSSSDDDNKSKPKKKKDSSSDKDAKQKSKLVSTGKLSTKFASTGDKMTKDTHKQVKKSKNNSSSDDDSQSKSSSSEDDSDDKKHNKTITQKTKKNIETKKLVRSYNSAPKKQTKKNDDSDIDVTPKKKKGRPKKTDQIKASKKKVGEDHIDDEKSSKGGFKIIAVNPSNTVLVYIKLPAKNFDKFYCKHDEKTIGLNLPNLYKFIRTMEKDATLSMFLDSDDMNYLLIKINNKNKNRVSNYKLNLLDLEKIKLDFNQAEFESYIRMPASDFQQTCKNMHNIAEFVEIKSIGKQLCFTCEGDIGSHEEIYGQKEKGLKVNNEAEIVQGIYELKHLVAFTKCTPLCENIEIYMRNDYPLIIKYTIASLGEAYFCLSPVIHNQPNDKELSNISD